jgi:hypothetical protein
MPGAELSIGRKAVSKTDAITVSIDLLFSKSARDKQMTYGVSPGHPAGGACPHPGVHPGSGSVLDVKEICVPPA